MPLPVELLDNYVEDNQYYAVYVFEGITFQLGEFVYLKSEETLPYISRIERIWTDSEGLPWFFGGPFYISML